MSDVEAMRRTRRRRREAGMVCVAVWLEPKTVEALRRHVPAGGHLAPTLARLVRENADAFALPVGQRG